MMNTLRFLIGAVVGFAVATGVAVAVDIQDNLRTSSVSAAAATIRTATVDPGDLSGGTCQSDAITVTGQASGDDIFCVPGTTFPGNCALANCTATGTDEVTVKTCHTGIATDANCNISSSTWSFVEIE